MMPVTLGGVTRGWSTPAQSTVRPVLTRAFTLTTTVVLSSSSPPDSNNVTSTTSDNVTDNIQVVKEALTVIEFSELFVFYSLAVIIPAGCVCNLLALATFLTRRMRRQSSCWYLVVLAAADTTMLVTELFRQWLPNSRINVNWYNTNHAACLILSYLSLTSRCLSSWTIVMFTIERMVCVMWPLVGIQKIANVKMAKRIIIVEAIASMLISSYILFLSVVREKSFKMECTNVPGQLDLYNTLSLVWILISTFLPVTVVLVLNVVTIARLSRLKRKRGDLFSQRNYEYAINKNRITVMLLTVSTCFIVLSTPYLILWIYVNRYESTDAAEYHTVQAILAIVRVFYVFNFAINLALYSITGSKFRRQLLLVVTCTKDDQSPDSSSFRRRSLQQSLNLQVLQRRKSSQGNGRNSLATINEDQVMKEDNGRV